MFEKALAIILKHKSSLESVRAIDPEVKRLLNNYEYSTLVREFEEYKQHQANEVIDRLRRQIFSLEESNKNLNEKNSKLLTSRQELEVDNSNLQRFHQELENRNSTLQTSNSQANEEIDRLKLLISNFETSNEEIAILQDNIGTLETVGQELTMDYVDLNETKNNLLKENSKLKIDLGKYHTLFGSDFQLAESNHCELQKSTSELTKFQVAFGRDFQVAKTNVASLQNSKLELTKYQTEFGKVFQ